ncbi:class I SAM-dependent DNA methyltransferase [Alicyclobacillus fodiniaquatilis]|uniref:Class I SAM-dependent DNA methyltransferase n=1 Tax=Alicyclobacillus fodiniaquatilis TaxID=1661150 RepID=A0ABW4JMU1_9BACL
MNPYEGFAQIYDQFMQDAPYEEWLQLLYTQGEALRQWDVADIGCGTGMLTVPLSMCTRTCVGVDASEAMLSEAQMRGMEARAKVQWLCQDIRDLRLPRPMDLVISTCDVINYLTDQTALEHVLRAVWRALKPGGAFAFDIIGPKRFLMLQDGYWHQIEEDAVLLHQTRVQGTQIEHDVHAFLQVEADGQDDLYMRIEESHQQAYYDADTLVRCLKDCGFVVEQLLADFAADGSLDEANRIIVWAKREEVSA